LVAQRLQRVSRWMGRAVGLDLHRDFCVVAICEDGVVRSAGRVKMSPEGLEALAASLECTDRVALEVSGGAWEVARMLEPHVERVVVVSPDDTGIAQARTKTDRLDARALEGLLWRGEPEATGAGPRPSATPPRPNHRPESPQIPTGPSPPTIDFHRSSEAAVDRASCKPRLGGRPILGWGFALVKRGPGGRCARARSPGWQVAWRTGPRRQPGHARLTSSLADANSAAIAWPVEARRAGLEACRLDRDPYSRRFGGSPQPPSRCLCPAACSSSVHTRRLRSRPRTSSSPTKATSGGRSSSSLQVDSAR
jgi:hypothetical protein